ncbi:glutaminase [Corynebacterium aquatimens]|uniref:Glutaminase n=1 Tax=Corynebacterium aquatimens TaxID=1190508 RepID=A0A931DYV6_9CORY|nr:glutaminase [Corynebacterium aquatimens]WJY64830.1 Glutaminase 1 [Corynebacterium aquatimens]
MRSPISSYLSAILDEVRDNDSGAVADYIGALKSADPDKLGLALCTRSGHLYAVGDTSYEFSIQSISKPFIYALALDEVGVLGVHEVVGVEPSGEAFNELSLDEETKRPANPMINAGAIAVNQLIAGVDATVEKRGARILDYFSQLAGREMRIDETVKADELSSADRNMALAHMLKEYGILRDSVHDAVETYVFQCSVLVTVKDLAIMAATLASGGIQPITRERVLSNEACRLALAVMASSGMYDGSGRWMSSVGIPAKSGVAGGLIGTLPGQLGIASLSPRLNDKGNSVRGVEIFRRMSKTLGLHMMSSNFYAAPGIRSVERHGDTNVVQLQGMINFTAAENILHDLVERKLVGEKLVLDVSNVTSFNPAGRRLVKEGLRQFREDGFDVAIYDPDSALPDYQFSDGTHAESVKDFSESFTVPVSAVDAYEAIAHPKDWWDEENQDSTVEGNADEQGAEFQMDTEDGSNLYVVQEADEGERLVWSVEQSGESNEDEEWRDTNIIFDLEEADDGSTRVRVTHRGLKPHDRNYDQAVRDWRKRITQRLKPLMANSEEEG